MNTHSVKIFNVLKSWWHGLMCWNKVTAVWERQEFYGATYILIRYECNKCGWILNNK